MDLDDFREVLESSGADVWSFLDAAIALASSDHLNELKQRRDGIIEKLYTATLANKCGNCGSACDGYGVSRSNGHWAGKPAPEEDERDKRSCGVKRQPTTPPSPHLGDGDDDDQDPFGGLFDDEQTRILEIKGRLEDPDQLSEESIVELLQSLLDMDITFQALKETDIGRDVNQFRKHSSDDVRRLVKHLVRKWKQTVDEWVNVNQPGEIASSTLLGADGDSPQQKIPHNGYRKIHDFTPSPNPHTGISGSESVITVAEPKAKNVVRRETPPMKPNHPAPVPPAQNRQREQNQQKEAVDADRLASVRKRLHENYKEAENAKKQRMIQVMDIKELPKVKPRNTFFPKNKAGGSHGRHW